MTTRPWVRGVIVGGALVLLGPPPAVPHPDITVEYGLELLLGPGGPEGLGVTWIIDPHESTELLDLVDANRDGVLSPGEVRRLEKHVRQEQGRSSFFTTIALDGEPIPTPVPQSFVATVDQGQLTYHFVLPIRPKGAARGTVDVVVDDPTYFIAFALMPDKPVKVTTTRPFVGECRVVQERVPYGRARVKCTYTRRGE